MSQKQSDVNSCYMDNICVKISEKYKPPPKITLAMTYAQRLTLNRQMQESMPTFNFELNRCVKEKMKEWRTARHAMVAERKEKLDRIKVLEEQQRNELEKLKNSDIDSNKISSSEDCEQGPMLIPTQTNILTPIPLAPQKFVQTHLDDASPINISDFESDTSSPFDNLELKTLNDLEELKIVLQNDDKNKFQPPNNQTYASSHSYYNYGLLPPPAPTNAPVYAGNNALYTPIATSTAETNGYASYYAHSTSSDSSFSFYNGMHDTSIQTQTSIPCNGLDISTGTEHSYNCVPDIIKTLQNQLNLNVQQATDSRIDSNNATFRNNAVSFCSTSQIKKTNDNQGIQENDTLENPFAELPKTSQTVCDSIASMGFPIARVARACKTLGDDEKKIVEYLLSQSQLMDLGFREDKVADALCKSDNDRDKALELLIS